MIGSFIFTEGSYHGGNSSAVRFDQQANTQLEKLVYFNIETLPFFWGNPATLGYFFFLLCVGYVLFPKDLDRNMFQEFFNDTIKGCAFARKSVLRFSILVDKNVLAMALWYKLHRHFFFPFWHSRCILYTAPIIPSPSPSSHVPFQTSMKFVLTVFYYNWHRIFIVD